MQVLAGSKVLSALLAALAVGSGVQTWYLVKVQRELGALRSAVASQVEADEEGPTVVAAPRSDPQTMFERLHERLGLEFGPHWPWTSPLWSDAHAFPLEAEFSALRDRGDAYELSLALPQDLEGDVNARVEGGMLVVRGEHSGGDVRARRSSRFERRMTLPPDADPGSLSTRIEDGRLHVRLEKRAPARASA
jgi:HSP20 family molecular chaperone IbpA